MQSSHSFQTPGQIFSNAFASDAGFTYDNTKAEFVAGLLRQKDQRPLNSVLGATYTTLKNLNWSQGGSLVATDIGTPVLNAGKLECFGGGNNAARYENADIGASGNVGAIKVRYTPNYSGTPAANYNIFEFAPTSGNNDRMLVLHSASGGTLRLTAYTSVGTVKHSAAILGAAWSPVAGTEYELELNWDTVAGQVRLFVDGVLQGAVPVSSYARGNDADRLYIGAGTVYSAADAAFNDVLLFSTVQHTAGYTPGYLVPEFSYLGSKIDGPNFTYTGIGTVLSVDDGSVTEVGAPRFIVGLQYWNGSAWVVSNGTYAQANDFATALANFPTFDTGGGGILPWSVVFPDSNTLSSVDDFSAEVTGQKYAPLGYLEPVQAIQVQSIIAMTLDLVETAQSFMRIILRIDNVLKYWNGTAWVTSDGSFAQANTLADFNANIAELDLGSNSSVYIRWVFTTASNVETAELDEATVEYDFGGVETNPARCLVYGYLKDISDAPISNAKIVFALKRTSVTEYNEANANVILDPDIQVKTNAQGYFEANLIRSSEYEGGNAIYTIKFSKGSNTTNGTLEFEVPDAETKDITDLLTAT